MRGYGYIICAVISATALVPLAQAAPGGGLPEGELGPLAPVLPGGATLRVAFWNTGLPGEVELYQDMVREFQRKSPDAQVLPVMLNWQVNTQQLMLYELRTQRDPADIILLRDSWLPEVADELLSLDTALGGTLRRGYPDAVVDACRVDGVLRALPLFARTKCLFYRPALMAKLNVKPPRTWDELPGVARKLGTEPGVWGFGLPGGSAEDGADLLLAMLWAQGGELVDDEGRLVVGQELLKAVQLCVDMVHVARATQLETCSWTQGDLENAFLAGRVGMLIAEPSLARRLALRKPKLDWEVAALPQWQTQATRLSVDCLAVSARSPQPELALQFLRHASQERFGVAMHRIGLLSARKCAETAATSQRSDGLGVFAASLEHARAAPARLWPQIGPYLAHVLVEALTGHRSPEAALKDLVPTEVPHVIRLGEPTAKPAEKPATPDVAEP